MTDVLDPLLDATSKGFPHGVAPLRRSRIGAQGWNVLAGDLPLPLAVIRRDALAHNVGWMQRFADAAGVGFAPHGKTTMSPQLFRRQLDDGAFAITLATPAQIAVARRYGVKRVFLANELGRSSGTVLFDLTAGTALFAVAFSTILGMVAGVVPAWNAARLDPVAALRYE